MKKILSFMVMSLIAIVPFTVNADSEIVYNCAEKDATGSRKCTVSYKIDANSPQDKVSVTLTEHGGAEITSVDGIPGSDFSIDGQPNEVNGVWSVLLVAPSELTGEYGLFTFTYTDSGTEDCGVTIGIGNDNKDITTTTPSDTPTDNVQTGSTLPYIALGVIAIVAIGAYVATKNKTKMYKI